MSAVPIRALIFDFDGLVLDTESVVHACWERVYRDEGVELPLALWHAAIGSDGEHFEPEAYLVARRPALDVDAMQRRRREHRDALLDGMAPLPGVVERLEEARRAGLVLAVASSSGRDWVEGHLDRLGLRAYFTALRSRDDVARVKPDPALYRAAVDDLGVAPGEAVAFEDSPHGVAAALAAGLRCVAVPGPMTRTLAFDAAHMRLGSLAELSLREILARIG